MTSSQPEWSRFKSAVIWVRLAGVNTLEDREEHVGMG
jgi:hypothetical protein